MIYFSIFVIILLLAIFEIYSQRVFKKSFYIIFLIIAIMASLRYGVGSDYFNYMYIYNIIPKLNDSKFSDIKIHGELGYRVLQGVFKMFNLNYTVFIFAITIVTMLLFYYYIKKNSKLYMTSMLIFYSMYYFTYINSGIRQGLSIGLFLVVLLPMLQKKQYFKYVIFTLLFSLIHSSILVVLILPLIFFEFNIVKFTILLFCAFVVSFIDIGFLIKPFGSIYVSYQTYLGSEVNVLAVLSRFVIFTIVIVLFLAVKDKISLEDKKLINYYIIGILIYVVFVRSDLIASRLNVYFKCFEIILIPNYLRLIKNVYKKNLIAYVVCLIMMTMWIKEVNAALQQGHYFNQSSVLKYPYTTVFNKEDSYLYRPLNYNYGDIY